MHTEEITEQFSEPVHLGDGIYAHRHGYDTNGNHSVWVSQGANRARKIQTLYLPKSHSHFGKQKHGKIKGDVPADVANELKDYHKKYHTSQHSESEMGLNTNQENFPGIVQMSELQVEHMMDEEAEEAVHPSLRRAVDESEQFAEHREPADTPMATELHLVSQHNVRPLSTADYMKAGPEQRGEHHLHQHREAVKANLAKKTKKGVYDHEKAKKLWEYHAKALSDHYKKHYGVGANPATRKLLASKLADEHRDSSK